MTGPFRGSAAENDRPSRNDGRALIDHAWFHRGSVVVRGAGPAAPAAWGSGPLDAPRFRAADVGSRLGPARAGSKRHANDNRPPAATDSPPAPSTRCP